MPEEEVHVNCWVDFEPRSQSTRTANITCDFARFSPYGPM